MDVKQCSMDSMIQIKGALYKQDAKDKGLMLNYCPWCGEKIDWFNQKDES